MEKPIKMDDWGGAPILETPVYIYIYIYINFQGFSAHTYLYTL